MHVRKFMTGFAALAATACVAMASVTTTASAANADPVPPLQSAVKAIDAPSPKVLIRNVNSDKCVAVPGGTSVVHTQLIQWPCGPFNPNDPQNPYSPEKMWYMYTFHDGSHAFENVKTGYCLTSEGGSARPVTQYSCGLNTDQLWNYYATGSKRLWNLRSQDCLAVPNAQTGDGVRLIHWTCGLGDEQQWKISYLD